MFKAEDNLVWRKKLGRKKKLFLAWIIWRSVVSKEKGMLKLKNLLRYLFQNKINSLWHNYKKAYVTLVQINRPFKIIHFLLIFFNENLSISNTNGYRIYVDIITGKKCRQFRLLTFIGQFVHPVGGKGWGKENIRGGRVQGRASYGQAP